MKSVNWVLVGALTIAAVAHGQVPGTNDTSDSHQNTGSGSVALDHLAAGAANNTAIGYAALYFNTTGSQNTAVGVLGARRKYHRFL